MNPYPPTPGGPPNSPRPSFSASSWENGRREEYATRFYQQTTEFLFGQELESQTRTELRQHERSALRQRFLQECKAMAYFAFIAIVVIVNVETIVHLCSQALRYVSNLFGLGVSLLMKRLSHLRDYAA